MLPVVFFCLSLPALSATQEATGFALEVGIETPPLYAVRVTRGRIIPTASIFSTIRLRMVVGITAPFSAVLETASARNSAGIGVPRMAYAINARRYSMLSSGSASFLCSPPAGEEGEGKVRTTAPPLLPSAMEFRRLLRCSAAAISPTRSVFRLFTSVSNAVNCSAVSSAPLCSISFAIAARRASISCNLFIVSYLQHDF